MGDPNETIKGTYVWLELGDEESRVIQYSEVQIGLELEHVNAPQQEYCPGVHEDSGKIG